MEALSKPIQANEIEWRVQSQTKDKAKIIVVPYITNRCVMERFDEQFGTLGWTSEFREIAGGFICRITAVELGVYREDGASKTSIEPEKGGISDSMKRCAVQFGLGRGLYNYPRVMIETGDKYIPNWVKPRLDKMVEAINSGNFDKEIVILKQQ